MIKLDTHATHRLCAGRLQLRTDYQSGEGVPGRLTLSLEDQETYDVVEGAIRLDPWFGSQYFLVEARVGNFFLLCGTQAVVAVDASNLKVLSSVGLEYEEAETLEFPWYLESDNHPVLIVATDRRVWCIDRLGHIRWVWSCSVSEPSQWISGAPVIEANHVCIQTMPRDVVVELDLQDGLPRRSLYAEA